MQHRMLQISLSISANGIDFVVRLHQILDITSSQGDTLSEPARTIVVTFKIERPVAKPEATKSSETWRLERLQRAQEMLEIMEVQGLEYRQVRAIFGVSRQVAFKLIKELKGITER